MTDAIKAASARIGYGALCCVGVLSFAPAAQAAEYALGSYLLGLSLPMAGYTPPPGLYFSDTLYAYRGAASPNVNFPFGRNVIAGVTEKFVVNIATISWFAPGDVLGGTFGLAATVPYGNVDVNADLTLTGPLLGTRQINRSDNTTGFGQPAFSAIMGWHEGFHHWNVNVTGFVPVGDYSPNALAIVSLNRPGVDAKGAYTWLNTQTGTELSMGAGLTFNMANTATDYTTGTELHVEAAWQQHFPNEVTIGFGGYFYQQVTNDFGSGANLGPFRGRTLALGPMAGYTFKAGETPVNVSARWFGEMDTQNRVRGHSIFATVSLPLYVYPSAAATAKPITTKY